MSEEELNEAIQYNLDYLENNIEMEESEDSIIYNISQNCFIKIMDTINKETLREIENYCRENNIIPNIIDKDKLDLVLRLGIQVLNEMENKNENRNI